jgi:hypothetical protein
VAALLLNHLLGNAPMQGAAAQSLACFVVAYTSTLARLMKQKEKSVEVHHSSPIMRDLTSVNAADRAVLAICNSIAQYELIRDYNDHDGVLDMQANYLHKQLSGYAPELAVLVSSTLPKLLGHVSVRTTLCGGMTKLALATLRYSFEDADAMQLICILFGAFLGFRSEQSNGAGEGSAQGK